MIKQFRSEWPTLFYYISAAIVAFSVWASNTFFLGNAEHDLWLRVVYAAAALLLFSDVLETCYIAWYKSNYKQIDFWMYAFYMGYCFAVLTFILLWRGKDEVVMVAFQQTVAGVFLGIATAFFSKREKDELIWSKYDLDNAMTRLPGFRRFVYYAWPLALVGFGFAMILEWDFQGTKPHKLLFQIIFLAGIIHLYPYKETKSAWSWEYWKQLVPRFTGLALLLFGMIGIGS